MESHEVAVGNHLRPSSNTFRQNERPNSLPIGPEKEPINFVVNLVGAPSEVEQLVEHIKSVAEQFLYHWKTFPLSMCNSIFFNIAYLEESYLNT